MDKTLFSELLEKELYSGPGCGEAKAFAYATAMARKYAPGTIKRIMVEGSALFVIGVQSNILPNTGGARGGMLASALGAIGGEPSLGIELLSGVNEYTVRAAKGLVSAGKVSIRLAPGIDVPYPAIYLRATVETDLHTASVILRGGYSNIVYIEQDGAVLIDNQKEQPKTTQESLDWSWLNVESIYDYCKTCDIGELERFRPLIDETLKASQDGLYQSYGMQVGRTTRENIEKGALAQDEISYILMWTTAGIDARMNGSPCPTVGNAGSGSQGHINCAAPIASGRYRGCGEDEIIRAVALATLLNIYMDFSTKNFAYLSPMCYCASIGSVAAAGGVAFLHGFSKEQLVRVLRTGLCIMPGVICDGASKATCALRVHAGLSGALQAMLIVERGLSVKGYEGFMNDELPVILENLYRLQKDGMAQIYPVLYRIRAEQNNIV